MTNVNGNRESTSSESSHPPPPSSNSPRRIEGNQHPQTEPQSTVDHTVPGDTLPEPAVTGTGPTQSPAPAQSESSDLPNVNVAELQPLNSGIMNRDDARADHATLGSLGPSSPIGDVSTEGNSEARSSNGQDIWWMYTQPSSFTIQLEWNKD